MQITAQKSFFLITIVCIISSIALSQQNISPINLTVSFNGKFIFQPIQNIVNTNSKNGTFWCKYDIGHVSDETRELLNFRFYEKDQLLFNLKKAPASDLYISNSGFIAFVDKTFHFKHELIIHFYSKIGQPLFSKTFKGASLFGFSSKGNKFAVGTGKHLYVISIPDFQIETYESGDQFDISENEKFVAIARGGKVKVYSEGKMQSEFNTGFLYPRKIQISEKNDLLAVIDKKNLKVFSLSNKKLAFSKKLKGKNSFRDLLLKDGKIFTGIHFHKDGISRGLLKVYDLLGNLILEKEDATKKFKTFERQKKLQKPNMKYEEIPWPFFPFDSMRTVWNYYEQHMGGYGSDWSYLHQGLDLITPIGEPVYSVTDGIVKCVLTLGGAIYWRTAISKEQSEVYSNGWLYAHLIESSIQFDVGDSVHVHDYLGNIIQWASDWGHIHFVEIRDSGLVWRYDDNEWGINFNPLLALQPAIDLIPPVIENVFPNSKFAFCLNETSNYLDPDSLYGDIDIIAKITDYVGDSPWQLPAFETYYWIKKLPEGQTVFSKTLGQRLNHSYNFYASGNYEPYATVLYKRDELLVPSSWMDQQRNFYQILTNNNGDSLIDLSEKDLAFSTTNYLDGDYRILVEALDEYGNSMVDSMNVKFRNGNTNASQSKHSLPAKFELMQNYPNPFNPSTKITFSLSEPDHVKLTVYNLLGEQIEILVDEFKHAGLYSLEFDGRKVSSGIYFYRLETSGFVEKKKMLLLL